MNPYEIFNCVVEGAAWLAMGGLTYITALGGVSAVSDVFSREIKSQEELENTVNREAKKLGMEKSVRANFYKFNRADSKKTIRGDYVVNIGGDFATEGQVRHELYHIHKGHLDGKPGFRDKIDYYFRQEPQAIAYEVFRLRF